MCLGCRLCAMSGLLPLSGACRFSLSFFFESLHILRGFGQAFGRERRGDVGFYRRHDLVRAVAIFLFVS